MENLLLDIIIADDTATTKIIITILPNSGITYVPITSIH